MRTRRWDRAAEANRATPTPLYPYPNAYDIKMLLDHDKQICYIGPLAPKNPPGQVAYDSVTIHWEPSPTPPQPDWVQSGYDDFSQDHSADEAWWAATNDFVVQNGVLDFSGGDGWGVFTKAPKAIAQRLTTKFKQVRPYGEVRLGILAGRIQAGLMAKPANEAFINFFFLNAGQGQISGPDMPIKTSTDYWLRVTCVKTGPNALDVTSEVFDADPAQAAPIGTWTQSLTDQWVDVMYTELAYVAYVTVDEYRVEVPAAVQAQASDPNVLTDFNFQSRVSHKYSGAPKWRNITIDWQMGAQVRATTTYPVFV